MSYLLAQILVCLLIAGLIGAIIGWLLRGGCSRRLRDCEDEWKMRVGSLENEYNSKVYESDINTNHSEAHTLYDHPSEHATLKKSEHDSDITKAGLVGGVAAAGAGMASMAESAKETLTSSNLGDVKTTLSKRNIYLDDDKISLYNENGVDFTNGKDLENDYDLQAIEGINHEQVKALKDLGIHTTDNLVNKLSKDSHEVTKVARTLNVKPEEVSSWVSMSDIIKLPGIDAKTAKLMQTVGISSLSELSVTNPLSLYNEMVVFNNKSNILSTEPSLDKIKSWTNIAKHIKL